MKRILHIYQSNPFVSLIVNSILFFLWATTMVLIVTIMAVAFTG